MSGLRKILMAMGGAYVFSDEYLAILAQATTWGITKPTLAYQIRQDQLLRRWLADGTWDNADKIYFIANDGSKQFGEIEWKNPSTHRLTEVANGGALIWDSEEGTKSDGLAYYNAGFSLSSLTQYQQNSAFIGIVQFNPVANTSQITGVRSASSQRAVLTPRNNSDAFSAIFNSGTAVTVIYTPSAEFNYLSAKRDGTTVTVSANGEINTGSHASTTVPTHNYFVLAQNNAGTLTAGSQVTSPMSFLIIGNKDLDGVMDDLQDFFEEAPIEGAFIYGELETLYPEASFEEITAMRVNNMNVLKEKALRAIDTETVLQITDYLEIYAEPDQGDTVTNGKVNINADEVLRINAPFTVNVFPFANDHLRYVLFKVNSGGTLEFTGGGKWTANDVLSGQLETYNVTLRKSANPKLIELNESARAGFWDNLEVGKTILINYEFETIGEVNTIASWDEIAGTITVTNDINTTNDRSNAYTFIGTAFEPTISVADYEEYGRFWIYENHRNVFVYSIPPNGHQAVYISADNLQTYGFNRHFLLSIERGELEFTGEVTIEKSEIGINFFASSAANYQMFRFETLNLVDNGVIVAGSITSFTAGDILGSGAYIHPNILIRGDQLNLIRNTAFAFRLYSASGGGPVIADPEYRADFNVIYCEDNIEGDFRSSNKIPTNVNQLLNSTRLVNLHYQTTIGYAEMTLVDVQPDHTDIYGSFPTDCIINGGIITGELFMSGSITFNNTTLKLKNKEFNASQALFIVNGANPTLNLIDCEVDVDDTVSLFTPGNAEPGGAQLAQALIYVGNVADETAGPQLMYIEGLTVVDNKYYCGFFLKEDDGFAEWDVSQVVGGKIIIKDSSINTSRWSDYTRLRPHLRTQLEVDNCSIVAGGMLQTGTLRVMVNKPLLTTANKTINANTVNFNFEQDVYITGGGTLENLKANYFDGASLLDGTINYNGVVRIHAVGTDITVVNTGNINYSGTITAGNFLELNGSTEIAGVLSTEVERVLATSDGSLDLVEAELQALYGMDNKFIEDVEVETDEVLSFDGFLLDGTNAEGFVDTRTGTVNILRKTGTWANGVDVIIRYKYYTTVNHLGVWQP
ncbi:MAG: hypothetical protein QY309_04840 [Cyclobacteriaceae bacterium]|nr:MAG: hypothetical protein QY309_04840 [Cyclobacteriaceae bacterium]